MPDKIMPCENRDCRWWKEATPQDFILECGPCVKCYLMDRENLYDAKKEAK